MSATFSPTNLTRHHWRDRGYRVAYVERYVHAARLSFDAWGFADFILFKPGHPGMTAIQVCRFGDWNKHWRQILENAYAYEFACVPDNRVGLQAWEPGGGKNHRFRWITRDMWESLEDGYSVPVALKPRRRKKKTDVLPLFEYRKERART